jgi:phage protein D
MAESLTERQTLPQRPHLLINGSPNAAVSQAMLELHIWAEPSRPRRCLLRLSNWDRQRDGAGYTFFDDPSLDYGTTLSVLVGEGLQETTLFKGEILGLEAEYPTGRPPELVVHAADRLHRLDRVRRSRGFSEITDADLADFLLSEHGLQHDINLPGPAVKEQLQLDQSDLELLQTRLAARDALVWLADDIAFVRPVLQVASQVLELTYGGELQSANFTASLEGQSASLGVSGWQPETKAGVFAAANQASLSGESGSLETAPNLAAAHFQEDDQVLLHAQAASFSQAQSLADVRMRQQARRFVQGRCRTSLIPELLPGQVVSLDGLGPWFDGAYRVSALHHHFSEQGFASDFSVQRPGRLAEKRRPAKPPAHDSPAQQKPGRKAI